jgi:spore photoproduct lyase
MRPEIKKIVIDPEFRDAELPHKIAENLGLEPEFKTKDELLDEIRRDPGADLFKTAKKVLFFTENKGRFLKKCPGSKGVVCCNYYTINSVTGCPYDCSYCILQHYIGNNPFITVFLNKEKAIEEIVAFLAENRFLRVGTGELADSLALDHLLDESGFFIGELAKRSLFDRVQFEFKTKSAEAGRLLEVKKLYPDSNIVAGFSVNVPRFSMAEEPGAASV